MSHYFIYKILHQPQIWIRHNMVKNVWKWILNTSPIAEILCVKNGRAIVVCGILMKWLKKYRYLCWKFEKNRGISPKKTLRNDFSPLCIAWLWNQQEIERNLFHINPNMQNKRIETKGVWASYHKTVIAGAPERMGT